MRKLLLCTGSLVTLLAIGGASHAADREKVFALVPKLVGVPFYSDVESGCKAEAAKLHVQCLFTGPTQVDEAAQVQIMRDLITKGVDGIAVAPNNPSSVARVIIAAQKKGIPVVTFDSDAPKSKRTSFIGTNNEEGGADGGEAFAKALPDGGTYAVITGGLAADNLNDRIKGFQSKLGPKFTEVSGSPYPCDDDSNRAIQLLQDILTKNPKLSGVFFSGGWPMFAPDAYMRAVKSRADDIKSGKFVVVAFDVQDSQLRLLKQGMATALVGQRPRKMGAGAIDALNELSGKKEIPKIVDTGVDLVTKDNVASYVSQ